MGWGGCCAAPDLRLGLEAAKLINQPARFLLEKGLILPILRLRVVGSQFDDDHVRLPNKGRLELVGVRVREVSNPAQGGAAAPKVAHLKPVAQEIAQLLGIVVLLAVFDARAVSNAIAHTGHLDDAPTTFPVFEIIDLDEFWLELAATAPRNRTGGQRQ